MGNPFLGEIRIFAGNYAPLGWLFCSGQTLPISEFDALFNLIGTTYGGDGQETFMLPDLQSRIPVHVGNGVALGEAGGAESVTLTTTQLPRHNHAFTASTSPGTTNSPTNNALAASPNIDLYVQDTATIPMRGTIVAPVGGSQSHENMQPFLCLNFIIAYSGIYPSPS